MSEREILVKIRAMVDELLNPVAQASEAVQGLKMDYEQLLNKGIAVDVQTKGLGSSMAQLANIGRMGIVAFSRLEIASLAVENAEQRQRMATERLNHAIQRYGANSREASMAQQELEISTRSLSIARERFWIREAFAIGTVIPSMIQGIRALIGHNTAFTVATNTLNTALIWRNSLMQFGIVAGIAVAAGVTGYYFGSVMAERGQA